MLKIAFSCCTVFHPTEYSGARTPSYVKVEAKTVGVLRVGMRDQAKKIINFSAFTLDKQRVDFAELRSEPQVDQPRPSARCKSRTRFVLALVPFLSILVVQIGTMKCFYCPQKDASVVLWDSLSPDDQIFLRDKYPDAGQGAVCDLCVRSARPSAFFSRHSSSTSSSSAPQSVDSGLQMPPGPLVVSGAATSLATESVEYGVVEPSASVAESSTASTGPATGSHQIDYCRTALVADQSQGSATHPPSTQSEGNGKPVYIHLLPASFVCAVKTIFLLRTSDKSATNNGSWN